MAGPRKHYVLAAASVTALLAAACGGGAATATPPPTQPAPTATRAAPTAAATTAAPTPTRPPATVAPTATQAPAPTPTPSGAVPTAVVRQPAKRGGVLSLRVIAGSAFTSWDPYDPTGSVEFGTFGPMLNNLLWSDPYGKGELTGDIADTWEFTEGGKVVTFRLRKGIRFHDGTPLTSKDVLYNIERGWKPREPRMTAFKTRFAPIKGLETPDDATFKVILDVPSNVLMLAMGHPGVLIYPAHFPFPEKKDDWKRTPIGSGPFKPTKIDPASRIEYVKNDAYFKQGMPYVDGLTFTVMTNEQAVAAFRTGRLDATNLDSTPTLPQLAELKQAHGWTPIRIAISLPAVQLNQKAPFTDPRVREAVHLALDREAVVAVWLKGEGSRLAPPFLLPPEFGGRWGISTKDLENRPGYTLDKSKDIARAKELVKQAGIDPGKFTINVLGTNVFPEFAETVASGFQELGFKTSIATPSGGEGTERLRRGDFDVNALTPSLTFDDPNDQMASVLTTNGSLNYGKWSNPKLDALFDEQDRTLDVAKRRAMILEIQELVLKDLVAIPLVVRYGYHGYMPYVKNYPTNTPFIFSNVFRWEQVWVEK